MTSPSENPQEVYHDVYDFSVRPARLGAILTWSMKSALRAMAAGRKSAHIHLICGPRQPVSAASDPDHLQVAEALPAFYSHPLYSGISLYRSRDDYRAAFSDIAMESSRGLENDCSDHEDINAYFKQTGALPKIAFLGDCLVDWHALQSQFPPDTFWVTAQVRDEHASYETWGDFIREAGRQSPLVRFVLLGRVSENSLKLAQHPNVVVLPPLGMTLSHEITALLHSDLYMGTPGGFTQAALFSEAPYDIFNCTREVCKAYGIMSGSEHLPHATARQRLHGEMANPELLLESLKRALEETSPKNAWPGQFEVNRSPTLGRFFISDAQSDAELVQIHSHRLLAIALLVERTEYAQAREALDQLRDSLPDFASRWAEFKWLSGVLEALRGQVSTENRTELLRQISNYCHPMRLVRRSGRYLENLLGFEGVKRDGWCEQKAKLVFAPSDEGDLLIVQLAALATNEPVQLSIAVNEQKPVPFALRNEPTVLEIPIEALSIPTLVLLEADRAFRVDEREAKKYSYRIQGAGLVPRKTGALQT